MCVHSFMNVFTNASAQTKLEVLFATVSEVFLGAVLYLGQPLVSMYCTRIYINCTLVRLFLSNHSRN